jgi:peptide/nickel transport system permease protein
MGGHFLRRVLMLVPMIIGISIISYAIIRLAPGDPTRLLADPELLTTEQMARMRVDLGLDQPLPVQYVKTMESLLSGNLRSFKTRETVFAMIEQRMPTTLILTGVVLVFGFIFGILCGVIQAMRPKSWLDEALSVVSMIGYATPAFWLALMLMLVFSVKLDWLPASGIRPVRSTSWSPFVIGKYLVLPALVLGVNQVAIVARYTRASMIEAMGQDYVRTARAKGLTARVVILRHALRNSLLPVITLLGVQIPFLLGGSIAIESIFALPGIGRLALDSVTVRDYPVILTINVLVAVFVLVGNLLSDIAYGFADPRIRAGG